MRASVVSVCIVLVLAAASAAHAQDPAERARQLFELGVAAMDRGQAGEAAGHFQQSYQLYPRASTACNMALVQERLGRPCDALGWYRQCAAIDDVGDKREHANRQAALLAPRCPATPALPAHDPFVREPAATATGVQIVEAGAPVAGPAPDHTLLGFGIAGLVIGLGGLGGGIGSALEAQAAAAQLPPPGSIMAGTPEGDALQRAMLFSDVALGLYIGGAVIGALGLIALIVDLAQPGVFGGRAASGSGPRLSLGPAGLGLRF